MSAAEAPQAGPPVAELVNRLAACPDDFLAPPLVGGAGAVSLQAVLGDVLADLGGELPASWIESLARDDAGIDVAVNWRRACLVACWLVSDPQLAPLVPPDALLRFLAEDLFRMVSIVPAPDLVADPDRREELARQLLGSLALVPAGESAEHAADRLATLDSVNRTAVEAAARAAEERAREVRAALERQRAAEAAARATRE